MKHIEVKSDRVMIGDEWAPRFLELPRVLNVPAGATVEADADSTWDYVEVAGTLRISREHDTVLRFTHLMVLPGGHFDCGNETDPMPRRVELIVRDVPIDLTRDPFQWGNGFLNFGKVDRCGVKKTAVTEATGGLVAGATTIELLSAPTAWAVGDEILIPDTVTPTFHSVTDQMPRRESRVTIAAIAGASVTLSKPLEFAHPNIVDPQGVVILRPRVANLTRNILVHSENPNGVCGHTVDIGAMTMWCYCYNEVRDLGRTTISPLDDTIVGTKIGMNQRGKYAAHHHHVGSSPESMDVGNVYVGRGERGAKWGLSLHQTSDTRVEQNIALDFPGACFVTEDGYEVRNLFAKNLAAYSLTHAVDHQGNSFDAAGNMARNAPGSEGTGFWFHGVMNRFEGNEAWNNFATGINLFNQSQPVDLYPGVPGGEPDTPLQHFKDKPFSFIDNVVGANVNNGFELWGITRFPYTNLIAAHTLYRNVFAINSDGIDLYLVNATVIGEEGKNSDGVHSSMGYVSHFEMEGGQVAGCAVGIDGGGGASLMALTGTVLQNEFNVNMLTRDCRFTNVMHVPLGNRPHQFLGFGDGSIWNGTDPLPKVGISLWIPDRGSRLVVKNWQGTGKDYLLFYKQSLSKNPAWYSSSFEGVHIYNCPVKGLTMQESWDRFGLSFGGDVLKEEDAIDLDGLVNGLARKSLDMTLGPPRAIVTFPTMREAAIPEGGVIRVAALLTGDFNAASDIMWLTVDGNDPYPHVKDGTDDRLFTTDHLSPGTHTIEVWRSNKDAPNEELPGSRYRSQYFLGVTRPPPIDPPPPTTTIVPNVVGMTPSAATTVLLAAKLKLGTVSSSTDASPAGHVFRQVPDAGLVAAINSAVDLDVSSGPPPPETIPPGTYALTDSAGHKITLTVQ